MPEGSAFEYASESLAGARPREGMKTVNSLEDRSKLAKETEEYQAYYRGQLEKPFRTAIRHRRLFLNQLRDRRLPHEAWRAFVPMPYAWSAIKSLGASFNELLFGINPPIQIQPVSGEHAALEAPWSNTFDYVFRKIHFRSAVKDFHEDYLVQGTAVRKNTLVIQKRTIIYLPTPQAEEEFQAAIMRAISEGNLEPPPIEDPEAFEQWRQMAISAGIMVPEIPTPGPKTIIKYRGPGFLDVALTDMTFDPQLDPEAQVCVTQDTLVPWEWVEERTGNEEGKIFDPEAVGAAQSAAPDASHIQQWRDEISDLYGLDKATGSDPRFKGKMALVTESWHPEDKKAPYRVILNKQYAINRSFSMPYVHGNHPYIFGRNYPKRGRSVGIPEMRIVERLLYELNTFRGLRLDALLIGILPVFIKAKDAQIADILREFVPGTFIETSRPEAVRPLDKPNIPPESFKEIAEVKNDIDEALGSLPVVRGQMSQPRVPATSTERALSTALARIKDRVIDFEMQLDPFIDNSLYIMYQFWSHDDRVRAAGAPADPMQKYAKEDFLVALEQEFAFVGATTAINKDVEIQGLREWFTVMVNSQIPEFKAAELAKYITDRMTRQQSKQFFRTEEEMAAMQQQQAAAAQGQQSQPGGQVNEQPQNGAPSAGQPVPA